MTIRTQGRYRIVFHFNSAGLRAKYERGEISVDKAKHAVRIWREYWPEKGIPSKVRK